MNNLVYQYTLDKLIGPLSNNFLAQNPHAIEQAILVRKSFSLINPSLKNHIDYQWEYLLNPLYPHIWMYLED